MAQRDSEALPEAFQLERFFGTARSPSTVSEIQLRHLEPRNTTETNEELQLTFPVHRSESSRQEAAGLQWFDVDVGSQIGTASSVTMATLTPSCFSLVLVCALRGVKLWMPMALTTPIFISQFAVLYVVTFTSPHYLFASGAWLVPNSASMSLNAMKTFATVLMLGQIAEEFHEISESMKVLRRSRLSSISRQRLLVCWGAITCQYVLALIVMVAAGHLILSRQGPIEPLWITYYVFMTLNFDNMLVKFIMYVRTMQRLSTWTVQLSEPETPCSQKRTRRRDWLQKVVVLWVPVILALAVNVLCRVFNVLPMTFIRYGYVSNDRPVVMFSSLSLPAGCCPTVASINRSNSGKLGDGVSVSVPCLARNAPEDLSPPPLVYWVAWPSHASSPTSLQVREGRGSDGSKAALSGHVAAAPLELVPWMQHHGFQAPEIKEVFLKLTEDHGGWAMYRQTFPYLASIEVFPFPWDQEVAIYAIGVNQKTGALSPRPAASNVLHTRHCPANCEICSHLGQCRKCKDGYRITSEKACQECTLGCLSCQEDAKKCSQCKAGFGLLDYVDATNLNLQLCIKCSTANCHNCDRDFLTTVAVPYDLPCNRCESGFGMMKDFICQKCEDPHCLDCRGALSVRNCTQCDQGFTLVQDEEGGKCHPCGESCLSCRSKDDCTKCEEGYVVKGGACKPCAPHCKKCQDEGAESCDRESCYEGYGPKMKVWSSSWGKYECELCQVSHCKVCVQQRAVCEECSQDFGVTVSGHCVRCGLGCVTCRGAGSCMECQDGFVLQDEKCLACSDRCRNCTSTGPGLCDKTGCDQGWTAIPARWKEAPRDAHVCRPCSDPDCSKCDVKGPGECDL